MMKLGKLAPKHDMRTLRMARYLPASLGAPPTNCTWLSKVVQTPMYGNDKYGDCTYASAAHLIGTWTLNALKAEATFPDKAVEAAYFAQTHGMDTGCAMLDVLNTWRTKGICGHRIAAYVQIDPTNHDEVMWSVNWFGGLYAGANLPHNAMLQAGAGEPWTAPAGPLTGRDRPGSAGGHAFMVGSYSPKGLTGRTWGQLRSMDWRWWDSYIDECYAVLSPLDWLYAGTVAPNGLNLPRLSYDLGLLRS